MRFNIDIPINKTLKYTAENINHLSCIFNNLIELFLRKTAGYKQFMLYSKVITDILNYPSNAAMLKGMQSSDWLARFLSHNSLQLKRSDERQDGEKKLLLIFVCL